MPDHLFAGRRFAH